MESNKSKKMEMLEYVDEGDRSSLRDARTGTRGVQPVRSP
jgi:hypothetical protein